MGFSFRKSLRIAPGLRMNLSSRGVGFSAGVKGLRLGVGPRGTQLTAGRGGFLYRKTLGAGRRAEHGDNSQLDQPQHSFLVRLFLWIVKTVVIGIVLIFALIGLVAAVMWFAHR